MPAPQLSASALRRMGIGLILLTIVVRAPALVHPRPIDDEAIYSVVAVEMVEGGKPYVDAVERKPPLLFWTYAALFALSGKYNWFALHAAALGWVLLSMLALYLLGRRLFGPPAGLVAALFYSLYQPWATWKNLAFNGEVLMNLPIAWGMVITFWESRSRTRPELLAAGALLAAGFLLKQPAAIAAVPLGVYLLLPSYRISRGLGVGHALAHAALLSLGFWGALGLVAGLLQYLGILREAYFWTVTHHDVPHGPGDPVFWIRGARMSLAFAAACTPLLIGTFLAVRRRWRRPRGLWCGREPEFVALAGLLGVSLLGTAASGRFYPHYYIQLVLPLAILAAPIYAELLTTRSGQRSWWLRRRVVVGWLGLTALVFLTAHAIGLARQRNDTDVGRYVRRHSTPRDRILVWGQAPGIYTDARRRPASRYVATFPLTGYVFGSPHSWDPTFDTSDRVVPGAWQHFIDDVSRHPPRYIIDVEGVRTVPRYPVEQFPVLRRLLAGSYEEVYEGEHGIVYRRRGVDERTGEVVSGN